MEELGRKIEQELIKEQQPEQLLLFEDERTQFRRDIEALKARLARLPQEKEQEILAIRSRYRDFVDHTFPVAVIFLVPESMAERRST